MKPQPPAAALSLPESAGAGVAGVPVASAVFEPAVLGDMFNHEAALMASVLQTFVASMAASLAEIERAMAGPDLHTVGLAAHRVKGACRMSGALAMGDAAQALETLAQAGSTHATQQALQHLQWQWRALCATLLRDGHVAAPDPFAP
jgi:HPt (histidine-containing phosphotransfer) domain-containing protein